MKSILFYCLLLLPFLGFGQTSGKIKYTQTTKVEIPDRVPKEFRDRIPKERKVNKVLFFDQTTSTYKNGENLRSGEGSMDGGGRGRWRMRMGGGNANAITFKDLESKMVIDNRDIMGKQFIIEEGIEKSVWKITGKKKQILDYMVMEASTMMNDTVPVLAYFTPQIPVSNGPAMHHGLPGMILEVNIDNGRNVIVATEVELMAIDGEELEKPSKGKKVTKEEFNQIRRDKMKEMREQRGGSRSVRIRSGE